MGLCGRGRNKYPKAFYSSKFFGVVNNIIENQPSSKIHIFDIHLNRQRSKWMISIIKFYLMLVLEYIDILNQKRIIKDSTTKITENIWNFFLQTFLFVFLLLRENNFFILSCLPKFLINSFIDIQQYSLMWCIIYSFDILL